MAERRARPLDIGMDLTALALAGRLPRAHAVEEQVRALARTVTGGAPRAAVLVGEPGSGKTTIVSGLVHAFIDDDAGDPWRVISVPPSEFLIGTKYIGEWETRLAGLIEQVSRPARTVLYIPQVHILPSIGRAAGSDSNVASALIPHIDSGAIAVIGETTPEGYRATIAESGALRRSLPAMKVDPADAPTTRRITDAVIAASGCPIAPPVVDRLLDLSAYWFAGIANPGRCISLLRRVIDLRAPAGSEITARHVLDALAALTGMPADFLDDAVPLDPRELRAHFASRVLGQDDAVDALCDVVALLKAGLTDPEKPAAVLLFVGPPGVGKTELARTLAARIFGDPARLLRFDMSEYQAHDGFERLIGRPGAPGLLTSAVREHPFAVILLDEIEKAHPAVFDLCLQIFDAGRLTDHTGQTADFRRAILILTSNVGAATRPPSPVGFGGSPGVRRSDVVAEELSRVFRPEFLNRIDRIIHFNELSRETATALAGAELRRVIARSGIARRRLSVDVDPDLIPLILSCGFSPSMGARALKRTVERLILVPLARRIVTHRVPAGSIVRLVPRGGAVAVDVVPPEGAEDAPDAAGTTTAPPPDLAGLEEGLLRLETLFHEAEPLFEERRRLLHETGRPGFYDDDAASRHTFEAIRLADSLARTMETLRARGRDLSARIVRRGPRGTATADAEGVRRFLRELRCVETVLRSGDPRLARDALVILRRSGGTGEPLDAVLRLARMYTAWARRSDLAAEVLDDRVDTDPPEDTLTLLIEGAGAFAALRDEAGLHEFRRRDGRSQVWRREIVRVQVRPSPAEDTPIRKSDLTLTRTHLKRGRGRLIPKPRLDVTLIYRPSHRTIRLRTGAGDDTALDHARMLLHSELETPPEPGGTQESRIRVYTLAPSAHVRDLRTGERSGNLDRILDGEIELLAPPDTPPPPPRIPESPGAEPA